MKRILAKSTLFLLTTLIIFSCNTSPKKPNQTVRTEWEKMSVEEIAAAIKSEKVKVKTLTEYFINLIKRTDKQKDLNAVVIINPDAITIAEQLDKEISKGNYRGVLHGIPVLIKDNIDTAEPDDEPQGVIFWS